MSEEKVKDVSLETKMPEQKVKDISSRIKKKLADLSHTSFKPTMFRVDDLLRRVNEKETIGSYEPVMVAIGPYHHGKDHLKMMEEHKLRYLQQLLQRRNESDVVKYVTMLTKREEEVRSFYAERREKDDFVEMMLLDGFFIIELFRKARELEKENRKARELEKANEDDRELGKANEDDIIFKMDRMINVLQRDMLLFENQLPFFVLIDLFDMTKKLPNSPEDELVNMALHFLGNRLPSNNGPTNRGQDELVNMSLNQVDHLLGLVHHICTRSYVEKEKEKEKEKDKDKVTQQQNPKTQCLDRSHHFTTNQEDIVPFIGCNIKLQRAGIRFRKRSRWQGLEFSMFEIEFKDGAMRIPPLQVNDETEWFFRNLIAYEQYHQNLGRNYFTDYAKLMDCLINSAKDVEELRDHHIIENRLGSDEAMSDMFNKLCRNVTFNPKTFCYSSLFEDVRNYCAATREDCFSMTFWKIKARRYKGELRYRLRNLVTKISLTIAGVGLLFALLQLIVRLHVISR